MNDVTARIASRLSLRAPQRESLEALARICEVLQPAKNADVSDQLASLKPLFPSLDDFERSFANVCFALATGVGKTRLMGAFMAHLRLSKGVRNFLVLAPNLTIYRKLRADFATHSKKYVFCGIGEFAAAPPNLVTADNWTNGSAIASQGELFQSPLNIHLFNIAKIVGHSGESTIRKLHEVREVIGQSYFDYLSELPDLVVVMDEAHRYRADGSMAAIDALRPVLGLELTATPIVQQGGRPHRFHNIVYEYKLAQAVADGYVKEPAVATRLNLTPAQARAIGQDALERLKLEDGMRLHENTKAELTSYAINQGHEQVKPFTLVIAKDTTHAAELVRHLQSESFCGGRYRGCVLEVHSGQSGAERDEVVEKLLSVESPTSPIEIVVHVNMLKEGWDVTNLYTIIPLRAANSKVLVEQAIGRGLRLPYGVRTGCAAVDTLTIVAHDHFEEIIEEARRQGYTFTRIEVASGDSVSISRAVASPPVVAELLGCDATPVHLTLVDGAASRLPAQPMPQLTVPEEQAVAQETLRVISTRAVSLCRQLDVPPTLASLTSDEVISALADAVAGGSPANTSASAPERLRDIVGVTARTYALHSISVPLVSTRPNFGPEPSSLQSFELNGSRLRFMPVSETVVVQTLTTSHRQFVVGDEEEAGQASLEDVIVRGLIAFDDISYDDDAAALYELAGQAVAIVRSSAADEVALANIVRFHQRAIAEEIHRQIMERKTSPEGGLSVVTEPQFPLMSPNAFNVPAGTVITDFRHPLENPQQIREMVFGGFSKCLYRMMQFESDPERRFAVLLESDPDVERWMKPGKRSFRIQRANGREYEPDFVIECQSVKYLAEVKRADQLQLPAVIEKAEAGAWWCERATECEERSSGKPWGYLLIPDDAFSENVMLRALAQLWRKGAGAPHT